MVSGLSTTVYFEMTPLVGVFKTILSLGAVGNIWMWLSALVKSGAIQVTSKNFSRMLAMSAKAWIYCWERPKASPGVP